MVNSCLCSPYRPDLGVCASNDGHMLCDTIDTPFERCMGALNCKMKTEMAVGSEDADPLTVFYQQMIPHHANAINMARVLLKTADLSAEPFAEQLMNGTPAMRRSMTRQTIVALGIFVYLHALFDLLTSWLGVCCSCHNASVS